MKPTYVAHCVRSGEWWGVEISDPEGQHVRGAVSQAKRLTEVEANVREVLSVLLDQDEDAFSVRLAVKLPTETQRVVTSAVDLRQEAKHTRMLAEVALKNAIGELRASGLSGRDIGHLLGISHQRVSQLD
jgi:hypothetical protein